VYSNVHSNTAASYDIITIAKNEKIQTSHRREICGGFSIARRRNDAIPQSHLYRTDMVSPPLEIQGGVSFAKTTKEALFLSRLSQVN
jgi:hypothetical protein